MPDLPNSNNLDSTLDSKVIYQRAESKIIDSIVDGIMSLKLGFQSIQDFDKFVGPSWKNSEAENKWLINYVYANDGNIDKTKPVNLVYKRYRDSLFNANTVVIIVVKYSQGQ